MTKESFIKDCDTNTLMIVWPTIYQEKYFWRDLIKIYVEIIRITISNGYFIVLIHHKNVHIQDDLNMINSKLSDINNNYGKFISFYEYNYDDIWIRDYGPQLTSSGLTNFGYNGYGAKYKHENDKNFIDNFIKKYTLEQKFLLNEVIIEGGNIINSTKDYILNKNPIIIHNSLPWDIVEDKLIEKGLTGDDTNGHIDNLVRFKNDQTILYMASDDRNHPDYLMLKELETQLQSILVESNIIDSMIPIDHGLNDVVKNDDGNILPFSYLNYIEIGNVIIFPINANTDSEKKSAIKEIFANNNIYFIESVGLLNEFGGLHCCSNNFIL